MIDLHNHILPEFDDGAESPEESLDIARQFVSEGVVRVAATPHLNPERQQGASPAEVRQAVETLQATLMEQSIPLTLVPGNELYLTADAPALLRDGGVCTLGGTRWVLVELSLTAGDRPFFLDDVLFQLQLEGFKPILAH